MQSIFGTDGIRGRYNKEITYSLAYKVGYALGSTLENNNPILIGRDTRISGDFAAVGEVSIGGGIGMGIRESDGALKAKMNAAIDTMKADGSLNTLIKKWFGKDANTF